MRDYLQPQGYLFYVSVFTFYRSIIHFIYVFICAYILNICVCAGYSLLVFSSVELNIYDTSINELKVCLYSTGVCTNSNKAIIYGGLNIWPTCITLL